MGRNFNRKTTEAILEERDRHGPFEDTSAIFETNLFPQAFRRYAHLIDLNEPFVLKGRVTDNHGCVTLNVSYLDTRLFYKISKSEKHRPLHFPAERQAA